MIKLLQVLKIHWYFKEKPILEENSIILAKAFFGKNR